jgi:hypothetical protein
MLLLTLLLINTLTFELSKIVDKEMTNYKTIYCRRAKTFSTIEQNLKTFGALYVIKWFTHAVSFTNRPVYTDIWRVLRAFFARVLCLFILIVAWQT